MWTGDRNYGNDKIWRVVGAGKRQRRRVIIRNRAATGSIAMTGYNTGTRSRKMARMQGNNKN